MSLALQTELEQTAPIRLHLNENPIGPSPKVVEFLQSKAPFLSHYPNMADDQLEEALSHYFGIHKKQITVGNGSEEILLRTFRTFTQPGDEVLTSQYSFSLYKELCAVTGTKCVEVPAPNLIPDIDAFQKYITPNTRLVVLDHPGNPVSTFLKKEDLEKLHRFLPQDILLILDTAYADYVEDPTYLDGLKWAEEHDNILVTRTFSKYYGLAGLRLGWGYGSEKLIDTLKDKELPFPVNTFAKEAARIALLDNDYKFDVLKHHKESLSYFKEELAKLGLKVIPTHTNFVCVAFESEEQSLKIYQHLKTHNILVKPLFEYGLPTFLRFTIGLKKDLECVIKVLREFLM